MYRYSGCRYPYPHRLTGDAYTRLMSLDFCKPEKGDTEFHVEWTPENEEYLIELVGEGRTWTEIADIFYAVAGNLMLHYARLVKKGRAPKMVRTRAIASELMEYVIANLNKKTAAQLAQEIGYHANTVTGRLRQLGWKAVRLHTRTGVRWEKTT